MNPDYIVVTHGINDCGTSSVRWWQWRKRRRLRRQWEAMVAEVIARYGRG